MVPPAAGLRIGELAFWRLMDNAQMQGIRDPKERGVLRSTSQ
jgi:hypothetical protein